MQGNKIRAIAGKLADAEGIIALKVRLAWAPVSLLLGLLRLPAVVAVLHCGRPLQSAVRSPQSIACGASQVCAHSVI